MIQIYPSKKLVWQRVRVSFIPIGLNLIWWISCDQCQVNDLALLHKASPHFCVSRYTTLSIQNRINVPCMNNKRLSLWQKYGDSALSCPEPRVSLLLYLHSASWSAYDVSTPWERGWILHRFICFLIPLEIFLDVVMKWKSPAKIQQSYQRFSQKQISSKTS